MLALNRWRNKIRNMSNKRRVEEGCLLASIEFHLHVSRGNIPARWNCKEHAGTARCVTPGCDKSWKWNDLTRRCGVSPGARRSNSPVASPPHGLADVAFRQHEPRLAQSEFLGKCSRFLRQIGLRNKALPSLRPATRMRRLSLQNRRIFAAKGRFAL